MARNSLHSTLLIRCAHATDFNDPVAFGRLEAGGFRIEYYLAQWVLLLRILLICIAEGDSTIIPSHEVTRPPLLRLDVNCIAPTYPSRRSAAADSNKIDRFIIKVCADIGAKR